MSKETVLVIGSGGREHAIVEALSRSPKVGKIFAAPGSDGMASLAEKTNLNPADHAAVLTFIKNNHVKLTVIGPEAPLVAGLADDIRAAGHMCVGASKAAAQLEGSKLFAKNFMVKYGIPTARFREFTNADEAVAFARSSEGANYRVLKADGLAAGKGVFVTHSVEDLVRAIDTVMVQKKFGDAGSRVIIEETLKGPEVSVMALTDGKTLLPFPASQDHKRVNNNDKGPNTGGMGAYAPTPIYDDRTRMQVNADVVDNFILGLKTEGLDFRGIIYFGLMLTPEGPKVLEFNVRLGDPETQAVLPLIDSDMYECFLATAEGNLARVRMERKNQAACTVVLASGGYPGSFQSGLPIMGLDESDKKDVIVFHAGTKKDGEHFITAGGRVLAVTGLGSTLEGAVVKAYQVVKKIYFKHMHYRTDIANQALVDKSIQIKIGRMKTRKQKEETYSGV
jgi:phosphoribosylamine--glycine ligase